MGRVIITAPGELKNALAQGHRWIVVGENLWLGSGDRINLDDYVGVGTSFNALRIEGGFGPNISVLYRNYDASIGPLIYSETSAWDLHFTGLGFEDAGPVPGSESPLCQFPALGDSYFKTCRWQCSRGAGLEVGPEMADNICFVNCWFMSSRRQGLHVDSMRAFTMVAGSVEANGFIRDPETDRCPQDKLPAPNHSEGTEWGILLRGTSDNSRGGGILMGTHLELDQTGFDRQKGVSLTRVRGLRVECCASFKSNIAEGASCDSNILEGTAWWQANLSAGYDTRRWNYPPT